MTGPESGAVFVLPLGVLPHLGIRKFAVGRHDDLDTHDDEDRYADKKGDVLPPSLAGPGGSEHREGMLMPRPATFHHRGSLVVPICPDCDPSDGAGQISDALVNAVGGSWNDLKQASGARGLAK